MRILTLIIITLLPVYLVFAQQKQSKILVGPNIQVSQDGNAVHIESILAANPKDPDNLLAAALNYNCTINHSNCSRIYVTKNGGNNWENLELPDDGGADPQIAFGINGTAYFLMFGNINRNGEKTPVSFFYRSEDGGSSWSKPLLLDDKFYQMPNLKLYDHPQMVADRTVGKFAGRLYVVGGSADGDYKDYTKKHPNTPYLFRSTDDGKSFIGPLKIYDANKWSALFAMHNLLISSNGTLFCPFTSDGVHLVISNDGGISFSSPQKILSQRSFTPALQLYYSMPQLAIDNSTEKFKDRIYCVYNDYRGDQLKIMIIYSADEGTTWSEPKMVDSALPSGAHQYEAAIAVNNQGVIGVRWFDTRGTEIGKGYNEYFTASTDGGETFLPAVKISAGTSKILDYKNELVKPYWTRSMDKKLIYISFHTGPSFMGEQQMGGMGGHYEQFAADAQGVFHDFWSDSRDDQSYQMYTSAIKVVVPGENAEKATLEFDKKYRKQEKKMTTQPNNKKLRQISSSISLQFDKATYDTITNQMSIPVRVKNISDKLIYGPIKMEISKMDTSRDRHIIPVVLNAANKQKGIHAQFAYELGISNALLPGAESQTIIWKFKVKIPNNIDLESGKRKWLTDNISDLHMSATGYMAE